ncbi:MAG: phosphoribosylformylglycinamidine synthase [Cyclobacteriaceae bacterium]
MIQFFKKSDNSYLAVGHEKSFSTQDLETLKWLFSGASPVEIQNIEGVFVGPRKEMITPWSTNAVEITQNCGVAGIIRIERFERKTTETPFDPMLHQQYDGLDQEVFTLEQLPEDIQYVADIAAYNETHGLALSEEEIEFLDQVSSEIGRPLSDSELFGFSQINSEHCRHKIFNGSFVIDGEEKEKSLFQWIKKTSKDNPNFIVSAYKDNVAFVQGPSVEQFAPQKQDASDYFETSDFESVISLKAETHNFPTTVEPFNGAATGSGGEIRDRLAGGQGSFPLAGTAVYMTSYPRLEGGKKWEEDIKARPWLYQTPKDILIKASNGASDFGNKYGQPLICGSLLTFEYEEDETTYGFDKVIMLAGGIGFAKLKEAKKQTVSPGEKIVVLGGDNYRIGMGGGAVSSVATGEFQNAIELNAVQRSNPEMQKRVANAIRAMAELPDNPIVSVHDHGAGGHLNCLSELVEDTGGKINVNDLPIGDPTLSDKEIMSNESQERMGLVIKAEHTDYLRKVSERERAPYYEVGESTGDNRLVFENNKGEKPFDLTLDHLFGASPKTILNDTPQSKTFREPTYDSNAIREYVERILQLEAVASKDWLTNKVDRSVTGKVATQQTVGAIQVPLNNVAVMALDFKSLKGAGTSIGHSPVSALINSGAGSRLSVAESLTNLVFAPLTHGLKGVSLSANWMWPAKNEGENARLYQAVEEISQFVCDLGINIPTGKDSLSMTQKYPDGKKVFSPGTVIVSTVGEVSDIRKTVLPALNNNINDSQLVYIDFSGCEFELGGSSFSQIQNALGNKTPDVDIKTILQAFNTVQKLIVEGKVYAGHDVSAGGLITTLLEMNFPNTTGGLNIDLSSFEEEDIIKLLFSEKPAIVLQVDGDGIDALQDSGIAFEVIGQPNSDRTLSIQSNQASVQLPIDEMRDIWTKTSHLLDKAQSTTQTANDRYKNYKHQPLAYQFPQSFTGSLSQYGIDLNRKNHPAPKAAIIREKGVNGDREMAYSLWMAGFDVKDVHMTDLVAGREDLSDINMIVFVGGFSNSDVLGSAKGWAGSFLFNPRAKEVLDKFYARKDTLSLGVCNGCQVMMELEKVYPEKDIHPKMHHNISGKFESSFVNVDILPNKTVMFESLSNTKLGIWLAHGEGRFQFDGPESDYIIPVKYAYEQFPGNPNGSDFAAAAVASKDGRHVAIMPHLERTIFPWNWAHYGDKLKHEVSPWIEPFVNARKWVQDKV